MKIAVGASSFGAGEREVINILNSKGVDVLLNPFGRKLTDKETAEHIKGCDGLLAGLESLNEKTLKNAHNLKAIARIGIGMDNVDMDYCKSRGIAVSNTPNAPTEAVAEMCLAALLSISRKITEVNADMHNGTWKKRLGFSLRGKNVLFVGYGRIARKFQELLTPFNCNFIIYDPTCDLSINELSEGLKNANIITLHANTKDEILNENTFPQINNGAVILNSARGSLISEKLLYDGLKNGHISHYWGDVFKSEPYSGKLTHLENAILTPHISTYTDKCRKEMEIQAVENILGDLGLC